MSATILVNDGQHRRAAIIRAIKERPELASESLSVVLFIDAGLKRSQQLFSDLNFHGAKPAKSLGVLYDHRDAMADLARDLATRNPTFRGLTEMEKPSIGKASRKLFTIGAIHQATQALLGIGRKGSPTKQQAALAHRFWEEVGNCIPDWSRARLGQVQSAELRQDTVHAHAVALQALGVAGEALVSEHSDWEGRLQPLEDVNWLRSAPHWEGKALTGGVVQKTSAHVTATANYLKGVLGLEVS
jgi:DNA sulfur modification protein DndB